VLSGTGAPLYNRGFKHITFYPWSLLRIRSLLDQVGVTHSHAVTLYSYFGGTIGFYEDFYRTASQRLTKLDAPMLAEFLKSQFNETIPYMHQLREKAAQGLTSLHQAPKTSYGISRAEVKKTLQEHTDAILGELNAHKFIEVKGSLHPDLSHPTICIIDYPFRMLKKVPKSPKGNKNRTRSEEGMLYEQMIFETWKEILSFPSPVDIFPLETGMVETADILVFHGNWCESCTEIDSIVVWKKEKIILWGSLKLKPTKHKPLKHICHIVSFFNNRGFTKHEYWNYTHVLAFISPEIDADWYGEIDELNTYLHEPTPTLEKHCQQQLSNLWENRNRAPDDKKITFKFRSDVPPPGEFFSINKSLSLGLKAFTDVESILEVLK